MCDRGKSWWFAHHAQIGSQQLFLSQSCAFMFSKDFCFSASFFFLPSFPPAWMSLFSQITFSTYTCSLATEKESQPRKRIFRYFEDRSIFFLTFLLNNNLLLTCYSILPLDIILKNQFEASFKKILLFSRWLIKGIFFHGIFNKSGEYRLLSV